ncbi:MULTISPECIES: SPFH domain-containing protein [Cyanophyceae]|uniref:flotillin family protein n=1 Tax=Cyanophyceae TaxID=3028117 RepID=UPI001686EF59|nr:MULTISPECIES: SPFH domain-containing protein [Cyanophyceae]MBD1915446.1 flotillin family protein [Phormidium sp. FACHB-77]MBD2028517.1 flotillin family protein [Phormidium sp. FACHB-322]MBD2051057.1 flotillin family protein [Leptolyngbya sp. FACHB-60]
MSLILALLVVMFGATGSLLLLIKNLYYVCQPSEVLIFSGDRSTVSDGRRVGYRLVKGGSSIRKPLLEKTFRMELTNMIIELRVNNSYSKGGIPLRVDGVANIKIAGEEPAIHNAIERLLGKSRQEIEKIARETLEGNLRGVLATLTPEQVNEDKMAFVRSLLDEADDDLAQLGLVLDNLQIQNISDDVGYLNSIGRKQRADLLRDARIAEAEAKSQSALQAAENLKRTSLRQIEAKMATTRADADRRLQNALSQRQAAISEAESEIAAEVARTEAELAVQRERRNQVEQQLQADVITPAAAACQQAQARAKGDAASIVEDGRARAEGIRELATTWKAAGDHAREIFLFQKLESLLANLVDTVPEVKVESITVIDSGQGGSATKLASFMEQMKQTTGLDLAQTLQNLGGGSASQGALSAKPDADVNQG